MRHLETECLMPVQLQQDCVSIELWVCPRSRVTADVSKDVVIEDSKIAINSSIFLVECPIVKMVVGDKVRVSYRITSTSCG